MTFLCIGTFDLGINATQCVPVTRPGIPFDNRPNSFAVDFNHVFCCGPAIKSSIVIFLPLSLNI